MFLLERSILWLIAVGVLVGSGTLAGCSEAQSPRSQASTPTAEALPLKASIERPQYLLPDVASFDAASIPPYNANHAAVYQHIDENQDKHLSALQRWLRQPSISAQNVGVAEMAEMVRGDLAAIGFQETALVETDGHPGVWGYFDAGADKTLMVYMMYDVQPVNEADWRSPPFEAKLVEHELGTALMARGATNQKGPQRAFLNALESILAVEGTLPVNLMITAEGEEELGSPNYPQIVDAYADRLATAEGVIFPFNSQQADGSVNMILGVKGIVYFEAEAQGGAWGGPAEAEIHGSYKAIVDSPVWRLVKALSTLVSEDGNTILVPGFYDGVRPPTDEEASLLSGIAASRDDAAQRKLFKVARWIDDIEGEDALKELTYSPTLNIDGIYAGYTGVGVKTILPHKATAKMDSRLPYGLDPDEALAKIRAHLDAQGYEDIKLTKLSGYPASQTSVSSPLARAAISVFSKYGATPKLSPRIAGSAPFYQFTERLQLPMIPAGLGFGSGAHAPNEIMLVQPKVNSGLAGLADIEKSYVDILYALAEASE